MIDVYEQHRQAFRDVSAYVVMRDGDKVATVAFKRTSNGAGKIYCYLHVVGAEMVRAHAWNDKHTEAMRRAIGLVKPDNEDVRAQQLAGAFRNAVTDNGSNWSQDLSRAGFIIWQAV